MNFSWKRFLAMVLAIVMVVGMVPANGLRAYAEETEDTTTETTVTDDTVTDDTVTENTDNGAEELSDEPVAPPAPDFDMNVPNLSFVQFKPEGEDAPWLLTDTQYYHLGKPSESAGQYYYEVTVESGRAWKETYAQKWNNVHMHDHTLDLAEDATDTFKINWNDVAEGWILVSEVKCYQVKCVTEPELNGVAKIGETGYETLADAIAAANAMESATVTLLTDVVLDAPLVVTGTVVLDLAGKTVTYNGTTQNEAMITNTGNLTINDTVGGGVINYNYTGAADPSHGKGNYTISNAGMLTVNGGKITIADLKQHAKYPINNNSTTGDAVLVINGGHLYNYNTSAIRQFCNSTTYKNSVTITGGVIEGYSAIWVQNPGKNTVNGSLSITGGEIKTTAAAYVNGTSELKDVASKIYCTTEGGAWSEDSAVSITGGTINENVYLAEEAPADLNIGNATFNGRLELPAAPVAKVGETKYESLQEALDKAAAGDTVTFLADITEDVTVSQNLTIDGADKTYTGKMTLKADTTIKKVNFDGKGYNGYAVETRGADYLTIEDCTAKNYGYGFVQLASATVLTTVKNVTVSNMNYGVKVDYSNEVVLENVDLDCAVAGVLNSNYGSKTITIKDCDISILGTWTRNSTIKTNIVFEGENSIDAFVIDEAIDVFMLAKGATLTAPNDVTVITEVEDHEVKYDNGTYTLVEKNYVAKVGEQGYETLKEAIEAANAAEGGATVTLLADVTLGEKLTISGNVTISGKCTITRDAAYTGTLFAVNAGATLTLDGGLVVDGNNKWTLNTELYNQALNREVTGVTWAQLITSEDGKPNATAPMFKVTGSVVAKNVTIQNNYSSKSSNNGDYGVFQVDANATLTMTGATVKHIVTGGANSVAHLSTNSVWTINDGTLITDTFAGKNGGVCRNDSGKLVMNGGEIYNNRAVDTNGTVVMLYKGSMEMNGGKICSNTGISGSANGRCAAIYGHSTSTFIMTDGEICHNTGISYGGVDVPSSIKVEISGGYVGENISVINNANADVNGNANTVITGGTFTQDVSAWLAPNTGLAYNEETGTYGVITTGLFKLHLTDPTTGEPATIPYLEGNDLADLVEYGKLFYADYYKMELEVLYNVKIDETVVIDYPMTINLNSHTVSATSAIQSAPVIRVLSDVTVIGEGKIDGRGGESCYAFIVGNSNTEGKLTIENGTFYGDVSAVSVTKGNLTINGGNFAGTEYNGGYEFTLNCIDANYKNGTAKIAVNGGVFYKFNPANNAAEGAGTSFCGEDYKAEADGDFYKVSQNKDTLPAVATITFTDGSSNSTITLKYPSERFDSIQHLIGTNDYGDFVLGADQNELLAYVANGTASNIVMTLHQDVVLEDTLIFHDKYFQVPVEYQLTLDLNGHTITVADSLNSKPAIRVLADVTVEDGTIDATAGNSSYAIIVGNNDTAGTLNIADGTYKGRVSAISITKGTANISGGYFEATEYNGGHEFTLNCIDANYKNGTAVYNITGGQFYKFNPENNAAEGAGTNFLTEKYTAAENNGVWQVVEYVQYIKDELLAGNDVTLTRDVVINDYSYVNALKLPSNGNGKYDERHGNGAVFHVTKPGVVLDLNGHSITWDAHDDAYCNKRQVSLFMVTITGNPDEPAGLTVKDSVGTGKVDVYGMGTGMYVVGVDATGTIAGGTWTNYPCKTCGASNIFLYPSHGGEMRITGGTFEQKNSDYLLGWNGSSKETTNNGVGVDQDATKVVISGGTFVNFNPEEVKFFDTANGGAESKSDGCAEGFASVDNGDGTYGVKPEIIVTFDDITVVQGNKLPEFTWTSNFTGSFEAGEKLVVGTPNVTVTGAGEYKITAEAYVEGSSNYVVKVVPGKLTVEAALVRVYARNNANVKFFTSLKEAIEFAVAQKGYVPVFLLGNVTVDETIVFNDTNAGQVELQGDQTGARTYTITSTHSGEMFKVEKGTLSVKNLKINAQGDAFYVTGGILNLNYHSQGKQFIEVTSQTGNCVYVRGGSVNVNGAKLTSLGEYPAIQGNGNYVGNVTITKWNIGDGTYPEISAPNTDIAIYWPGNGKLTVEGGKITGDTALYAKSGNIVINGGEFISDGEAKAYEPYGNGAHATGDAVVIETSTDAAYETPTVSITGGTFTSANAQPIAVYGEGTAIEKFITGGTTNKPVELKYCAEGYASVYENGVYVVKECVAIVGNLGYMTLGEAVAAAEDQTVILMKDVDLANEKIVTLDGKYNTYFLVEGKTVTVNLNGKKVSGTYSGESMLVGVFSTENDGHLTLTGNGTVNLTEGKDATVYALMSNYDDDCTITIENGNYTLNSAKDCLLHSSCDKGLIIKGGNFELGNVAKGHWSGNRGNGSPWIINVNGQNAAAAVVSGGTYNFNVAKQYYALEVDIVDANGNLSYVIDNGDGTWTVTGKTAEVGIVTPTYRATYLYGYATMKDAVASIAKGAPETTIVLQKDITVKGQFVGHSYAQKVVIDLNEYKMSSTDKALTVYRGGTEVTIKNGTVHGNTTGGTIQVTYGGKLTLGEDVTITCGGSANAIKVDANSTLIIADENVKVLGGKNDLVVADGAKVEISAGTYKHEVKEAWIVEGYMCVKNVDGTYSVVKDPAYGMTAKIGDNYYETLAAAIEAAQTGDTITLLADVNVDADDLVVSENLDGNHTFFLVEGKSITIDLNDKNVYADASAANKYVLGVFSVANGGKLTLTGDGTVQGYSGASQEDAYLDSAKGNKDYNYKFYTLLISYDEDCCITVNGGNYVLDYSGDSMAYSSNNEGIVVNGGTFTLGNLGGIRNGMPWVFNARGQNTRHVVVNGGSFCADIQHQYYPFEVLMPETKALKLENGMYTVVDAVAYVTEREWSSAWYTNKVGYATLEEAIAACEGPKTRSKKTSEQEVVVLLKDITLEETLTIASGKSVVLDLNDKTLSYKCTEAKASCAINNKGALTIQNGTVTYEGVGDSSFGYGTNTINNSGKLTVAEGAKIINTTNVGSSNAIDNGAGADLIINGGEIKAEKIAIRLCPFGNNAISCTINDGTISGARAIQIQLPSSNSASAPEIVLTINGGTFTGTSGLALYSSSQGQSFANVKVTIAGGTFNGDVAFGGGYKGDQETVTVTGGTFNGYLGRYLKDGGWEDIEVNSDVD